jgi:hypothetical protein
VALGTPVAAAAAYSAQNGTTVSPAYPAGILATDVVLLFVGMKPAATTGGTVTTPTGWTLREELTQAGGYTAQGADTGNTSIWAYSWNTPVAGQTGTLSVTLGGNNVTWAFMVRIPKGTGAAQFGSADGQRTTTPTSPMSIALTNGASATNFQTGDRAIWAMVIPTDVQTPTQFSAQSITATGATFGTATELNEPDSTTGNDIGGYSAWAAVTAGSSTTAPTVTVTMAGTLTNVRGPVGLIRVREGAAPQTLTPNLYTNTNTFHNPTVSPGAVALTPSLYTNTQTFYSADVTQNAGGQTLSPARYDNLNTFYTQAATATYALTPATYENTNTFYSATVGRGTINLSPVRYDNTNTFYSATVTAGTVNLSPAKYDNANTFYAATVTAGSVNLSPSLYQNVNQFYSPVVQSAAYIIAPDLYVNTNQFYAASVGKSNQLQPNLYQNTNTFYAAQVKNTNAVSVDLYQNTNVIYSPTVSVGAQIIAPGLLVNSQQFYPAQASATYALVAQGYAVDGYVDEGYYGPNTFSVQEFYSAVVQASKTILAPYFVNQNTFFVADVSLDAFVITRAQALQLYNVYLLQGLQNPLVVSPSSRVAGPINQTITQNGNQVTIATTSSATSFGGDVGTLIAELAALHGIGSNLIVTDSSRSSGPVVQSLASVGGITTVTRQ